MTKTIAIVPLKPLCEAKGRLSPTLLEPARRALVLAMAGDVLAALNQARHISATIIVTNDPDLASMAGVAGAHIVPDLEPGNLNRAVQAGVEQAARQGADRVFIVHGDLPLLSGTDVDEMVETYEQKAQGQTTPVVGMQACKQGEGTNILMLPCSASLPLRYGEGSYGAHQGAIKARGFDLVAFSNTNAALDIDTPFDVDFLARRLCAEGGYRKGQEAVQTRAVLQKEGFLDRPRPSPDQDELNELSHLSLPDLMTKAAACRDLGHGPLVTYSRKVFLPLTHLCRDVCHYCTFAQPPRKIEAPYMTLDAALRVAEEGAKLGCKEALFTLGEKPELRYRAAREALADLGFVSTLEYVAHVAQKVWQETGLLPHINAGNMNANELAMLRPLSASMGLMLESGSTRLCEPGGPHYGSPDKDPAARLETIALAGQAQIPFTTGLLIGIGETREEVLASLLQLRGLHETYGHIQELIIQNFIPKPETKMAAMPQAAQDDFLWAIAMARLVFGPAMNIQAPPNLSQGGLQALVNAGINDWGGVSPLTPDFVNPESPWPHINDLAQETAKSGKALAERLTVYPKFAGDLKRWADLQMRPSIRKLADGQRLARPDAWVSGVSETVPLETAALIKRGAPDSGVSNDVHQILSRIGDKGALLESPEIERLFQARGNDFAAVCTKADDLRRQTCGDQVTYVVNRNINYTNICTYHCHFCAFSKGPRREELGGAPYLLPLEEIQKRSVEAWGQGATEVCLQGGIHPKFDGQTYLDICHGIKDVLPTMHIHAFSPLEVTHGAQTLGMSLEGFLKALKQAGLNSLPGTAAEILDDDVRRDLCPDKLSTDEWLNVIETAHTVGLKTTATIMFGHVDGYTHWARHLIHIRDLQRRTSGFTEFVPLAFVAGEAPMYRKGLSRQGPSFREAILMHAVARLVLHPFVPNIQASWVKMGREGAKLCLAAGCNDMGGTLTDESITRAAGAAHGQEVTAQEMADIIRAVGRVPSQRSTLYQSVQKQYESA